GRERGSDQHQQEADNAKDDEQFQKRKGGRSAAVFSSGRSSDRRSRREQSVAGKPSRQYRKRRARPWHVCAQPPCSRESRHSGERSISDRQPAGKQFLKIFSLRKSGELQTNVNGRLMHPPKVLTNEALARTSNLLARHA